MDLAANVIAENIDQILRRSAMRLEQERIHVRKLPKGSAQSTAANAALEVSLAAFGRLKAYGRVGKYLSPHELHGASVRWRACRTGNEFPEVQPRRVGGRLSAPAAHPLNKR